MARLGTPKRRKEKENYFNPGVVGRVTGVELPDKGVRDEHGMEPIEGIFSSVEKTTRSRRESHATDTSSEDMDIGNSSGLEPAEALTERRVVSARNAQSASARDRPPPPIRRSPIKTNIGDTPRRHSSLGPHQGSTQKSATPRGEHTPRTARRILKFGPSYPANDLVRSIERSPSQQRDDELGHPRRNQSSSPSRRPPVVDIIEDNDTEEFVINGAAEDSPAPQNEDDLDPSLPYQDEEALDPVNNESVTAPLSQKRRTRQSDVTEVTELAAPFQEELYGDFPGEPVASDEVIVPVSTSSTPQKRKDRPLRSSDGVDGVALLEDIEEEPATKRPRSSLEGENSVPEAKGKRGRKPGTTQTKKPLAEKKAQANGGSFHDRLPVRQQSLQRDRHETPMDGGVAKTRSGRTTYKPLDYWKGEHAVRAPGVYGSTKWVVRKDDVTPVKRSHRAGKPKRKRNYTVFQDEEDEDDDDDGVEEWETEDGVVGGPVKVWDPELPLGSTDEEDEQGKCSQIAFAAARIVPRDVEGSDFQFAKTLTLPFFGSGIVELPPKGFKRHKNSRKMQMCFFVHYGKVTVDVAGTVFTITKGGMWQVPRGNLYSIRNETEHSAKIFFAQGCEIAPELREKPA